MSEGEGTDCVTYGSTLLTVFDFGKLLQRLNIEHADFFTLTLTLAGASLDLRGRENMSVSEVVEVVVVVVVVVVVF